MFLLLPFLFTDHSLFFFMTGFGISRKSRAKEKSSVASMALIRNSATAAGSSAASANVADFSGRWLLGNPFCLQNQAAGRRRIFHAAAVRDLEYSAFAVWTALY